MKAQAALIALLALATTSTASAGTLRAWARGKPSGKPLGWVAVQVSGQRLQSDLTQLTQLTDDNGLAVFAELPAGDYRVQFHYGVATVSFDKLRIPAQGLVEVLGLLPSQEHPDGSWRPPLVGHSSELSQRP